MPTTRKTVREVVRSLAPDREQSPDAFAAWPPDVFALTSCLLWETDAYVRCVSPAAGRRWPPSPTWVADVRAAAEQWVAAIESTMSRGVRVIDRSWELSLDDFEPARDLPPRVSRAWAALRARADDGLHEVGCDPEWIEALLELHALADESGRGLGRDVDLRSYPWLAFERLKQDGTLALLDPSRGRVLPKFHTPQCGIALRSLSRFLAFDRSPTHVTWNDTSGVGLDPDRPFRCLVLPWPVSTKSLDFRAARVPALPMSDQAFGFFDFEPGKHASDAAFQAYLDSALIGASEDSGTIDIVVLPEMSMNEAQLEVLRATCRKHGVRMFVGGVRSPSSESAFGSNVAVTAWLSDGAPDYESTRQAKHHRWCLTADQVAQYQLGGVLHSARSWWEAIEIPPRTLGITKLGPNLSFCTLICEDLARQDPMAGLVRSIGPSLVIALLMDGPQLVARWSSRYAAVLADDPGSSVLTVTSLGMAERTRSPSGGASRVVALWKDPSTGPREIELEEGAIGVVLGLCPRPRLEFTADSRDDGGQPRHSLALGGVVQVRA